MTRAAAMREGGAPSASRGYLNADARRHRNCPGGKSFVERLHISCDTTSMPTNCSDYNQGLTVLRPMSPAAPENIGNVMTSVCDLPP